MKHKLSIVAIALCLLPAVTVFGQELKKEKLKGTAGTVAKDYAVFYSVGMPESAIWPLGMDLSRDGATIRHTPAKGNGSNTSVNDKVPFRFIIAPADGGDAQDWAETMGFNSGGSGANTNLDPNGGNANLGCRAYSTQEFPDGWRMPTQREMMIMWLFREGINAIYPNGKIGYFLVGGGSSIESRYWTATESSANRAWFMDFSATTPESNIKEKDFTLVYRCVRDY